MAERESDDLWGSYRAPTDWYRSWYGHLIKHGGVGNQRVNEALLHYGQGEASWPAVLWGLTHMDEIGTCPGRYDHLLAVPLHFGRGYWSANVVHYFGLGLEYAYSYQVDAMLCVDNLDEEMSALYGMDVSLDLVNATGEDAEQQYTSEMLRWVWDADAEMYARVLAMRRV